MSNAPGHDVIAGASAERSGVDPDGHLQCVAVVPRSARLRHAGRLEVETAEDRSDLPRGNAAMTGRAGGSCCQCSFDLLDHSVVGFGRQRLRQGDGRRRSDLSKPPGRVRSDERIGSRTARRSTSTPAPRRSRSPRRRRTPTSRGGGRRPLTDDHQLSRPECRSLGRNRGGRTRRVARREAAQAR